MLKKKNQPIAKLVFTNSYPDLGLSKMTEDEFTFFLSQVCNKQYIIIVNAYTSNGNYQISKSNTTQIFNKVRSLQIRKRPNNTSAYYFFLTSKWAETFDIKDNEGVLSIELYPNITYKKGED